MTDQAMTRRNFMKGCGAGASVFAAVSLVTQRSPAAENKRPNIILIVTDDHGRGDLGGYGNPVIQTPNLDRLAAEGVRFTNAFCTTASCSASRSVILSGLYNHYNGQYGHQHSYHHFVSFDYVRSLPVLLSQGGYHTARIGKYHVAPDEIYKFETVLQGNDRNAVQMANNCAKFFETRDRRPFFLYVCTSDPHRGGGKAADLPHQPDRFGNREQGYPGVTEVKYDPKEVVVPDFLPDSPECRAELAQYCQAVSRIDQGIGRLVEHLKKAGQYDNTVLIYISDNGIAFPGAKTTAYEAGLNLPCIVRTPWQRKKGIACDALVNWADLAPTILDLAGATPTDYEFHGRSFKPVLEREHVEGWDTTYASHTFHEITMYYPMRMVRGGSTSDLNLAHEDTVRQRPVGIGHLAGNDPERQQALRQADGRRISPSAEVRAVRSRKRSARGEEPGRRPAIQEQARRDEGQPQGFPETDQGPVDSQVGV